MEIIFIKFIRIVNTWKLFLLNLLEYAGLLSLPGHGEYFLFPQAFQGFS